MLSYEHQRNELFRRHAIAAVVSCTFDTALCHPLDNMKILVQVAAKPGESVAVLQSMRNMWSTASHVLFRGVGLHAAGRATSIATRFTTFRIADAFIQDGRHNSPPIDSIQSAVTAGALAGCVESLLTTPFEVPRVRLQANTPLVSASTRSPLQSHAIQLSTHHNAHASPRPNPWLPRVPLLPAGSPWEAVRCSVGAEGWRGGLWRGLRVAMARDVAYGALFFGCWRAGDVWLAELKHAVAERSGGDSATRWTVAPGAVENTVEAAMAAGVAAVLTHPLDTAKTRTQATVFPKHVAMEKRVLGIMEVGTWWQNLAGLRAWERHLQWHGVGLRVFQHTVATAVLVGTYHMVLKLQMRE